MIVVLIVLIVFIMGVGIVIVVVGYSVVVVGLVQGVIYVVGVLLIQKVLGFKWFKFSVSDVSLVYIIGVVWNQLCLYQFLLLLLGGLLCIVLDVVSNFYIWYEVDDQYFVMILMVGINVGCVEVLYNGDVLLLFFEGVMVWYNGFFEMFSEDILFYSNVDMINGGVLEVEKGQVSLWVQCISSLNMICLKVDVDFMLFDMISKGKLKDNCEMIEIQYCVVGIVNWSFFGFYLIVSWLQKQQCCSYF